MTGVDTARDVAVLWTLDFDAELPCESKHSHYLNQNCSKAATHVYDYCEDRRLVCLNASAHLKACVEFTAARCLHCGEKCSECWSIRPI